MNHMQRTLWAILDQDVLFTCGLMFFIVNKFYRKSRVNNELMLLTIIQKLINKIK